MLAILKVIWFFVVLKLDDELFSLMTEHLNEETVTKKLVDLLPFLNGFGDLNKYVTKFFEQLQYTLFFTILLLGLDLINGQFKGFKGPFKIILNAIIYAVGFGSIFLFTGGFAI